jgi:invasion protein IalB
MNSPLRRALVIGLPIVLLLAGVAIGWIGHNLASPPEKEPSVVLYGNWRLGCAPLTDQKGSCSLQLPVIDGRSGATVASLMLGHSATGLKLEVTLPLDVLIVPGMGLILDKEKLRAYRYETCTAVGCVAVIPADDKFMASFQKAQKAQLLFVIPNSKKPYGLTFSLSGYGVAYDAFVHDDELRHSWWRRLVS